MVLTIGISSLSAQCNNRGIETPEKVNRAVALLGHIEQVRYFFDRLENPEWIMPLKAKGFFNMPPKPQHDEERGTVGFTL
jgi:hypothetical protein